MHLKRLKHIAIFSLLISFLGFAEGYAATVSEEDAEKIIVEKILSVDRSTSLPITKQFAYIQTGTLFRKCEPEKSFFYTHWVPGNFWEVSDDQAVYIGATKPAYWQNLVKFGIYDVTGSKCVDDFPTYHEKTPVIDSTIYTLEINQPWVKQYPDLVEYNSAENKYLIQGVPEFSVNTVKVHPLSEYDTSGVPNANDYVVALASYDYVMTAPVNKIWEAWDPESDYDFDTKRKMIALLKVDVLTDDIKLVDFKNYGQSQNFDFSLPVQWALEDCCS